MVHRTGRHTQQQGGAEGRKAPEAQAGRRAGTRACYGNMAGAHCSSGSAGLPLGCALHTTSAPEKRFLLASSLLTAEEGACPDSSLVKPSPAAAPCVQASESARCPLSPIPTPTTTLRHERHTGPLASVDCRPCATRVTSTTTLHGPHVPLKSGWP